MPLNRRRAPPMLKQLSAMGQERTRRARARRAHSDRGGDGGSDGSDGAHLAHLRVEHQQLGEHPQAAGDGDGGSPRDSAAPRPPQAPTVRNIVLKHGDLASYFNADKLDVVCLQVRGGGVPIRLAPAPPQLRRPSRAGLPATLPERPTPQEVKLPEAKLTKELACVEGFEVGRRRRRRCPAAASPARPCPARLGSRLWE